MDWNKIWHGWLHRQVCPQTKSGSRQISAASWAICETYDLCDYFPPPALAPEPLNFNGKWLKWRAFAYRCAFCQIETFSNPASPRPRKPPKIGPFVAGLRNFLFHFAFKISSFKSKHPLSEPHEGVLVNRQSGVVDSKYLVVSDSIPTGHVTWSMRSAVCTF